MKLLLDKMILRIFMLISLLKKRAKFNFSSAENNYIYNYHHDEVGHILQILDAIWKKTKQILNI